MRGGSNLRPPTEDGADIDIEQWLPLVRWVMVRLPEHVYRRLEFDDIYQAGVIGLLNAKRLFRADHGATFKTFSVHKIRWAIYIAAGLTKKGWEPLPVRFEGDFESEYARRVS